MCVAVQSFVKKKKRQPIPGYMPTGNEDMSIGKCAHKCSE